jgi:hypothetical protein
MSKHKSRRLTGKNSRSRNFFGQPPVLKGEDVKDYEKLSADVHDALQPRDVIDEILARDFVDQAWLTPRLRRCATEMITANWVRAVLRILLTRGHLNPVEAPILLCAWAEGVPSAIEEVDAILAGIGADEQTIQAWALAFGLEQFERIDRLARISEGGRNATLREFDRRRAARCKARELDDVEYKVIRTKAITSKRKPTKDAA